MRVSLQTLAYVEYTDAANKDVGAWLPKVQPSILEFMPLANYENVPKEQLEKDIVVLEKQFAEIAKWVKRGEFVRGRKNYRHLLRREFQWLFWLLGIVSLYLVNLLWLKWELMFALPFSIIAGIGLGWLTGFVVSVYFNDMIQDIPKRHGSAAWLDGLERDLLRMKDAIKNKSAL